MYIAIKYIGKKYTPGEILPDNLPADEVKWLLEAGAIRKAAPAPGRPAAPEETEEEPEGTDEPETPAAPDDEQEPETAEEEPEDRFLLFSRKIPSAIFLLFSFIPPIFSDMISSRSGKRAGMIRGGSEE